MANVWIRDGSQMLPLKMEVDTGAQISTMRWKSYKQDFGHLPLKRSSNTLQSVDSSKIKGACGLFTTKIMFGGRIHRSSIYVIKG
ncbi:MAG: hypothetical protein GY696_38030 [Gammaproteobacteria bacterium]|nr:hypothetical protein [Gammaproteobacteria bacterium]